MKITLPFSGEELEMRRLSGRDLVNMAKIPDKIMAAATGIAGITYREGAPLTPDEVLDMDAEDFTFLSNAFAELSGNANPDVPKIFGPAEDASGNS